MIKTFRQWLEGQAPPNPDGITGGTESQVGAGPAAWKGQAFPFTGELKGKQYNQVWFTIADMDDDEDPQTITLDIFSDSPSLTQRVSFVNQKQDGDKFAAEPDQGQITVTRAELDEIIGGPWRTAMAPPNPMGGGGLPGGAPGGL